MGLMAEQGAPRRGARQTYRTMARMQRRRSFVESRLGMKEDFSSREQPAEAAAVAPSPAAETNPSTWASWRVSPSSGIRASSPTRISKPRRSSSSVSKRRVRRRGEHLGRGHALRPSFMLLFTQLPGILILRTSPFGHSRKFATPSNVLATVKIRQMGDVPSTAGLLTWLRCTTLGGADHPTLSRGGSVYETLATVGKHDGASSYCGKRGCAGLTL